MAARLSRCYRLLRSIPSSKLLILFNLILEPGARWIVSWGAGAGGLNLCSPDWRKHKHMIVRLILLAALLPMLAACGNLAPAPNAGSPYDLGDRYLDKNGNPLPGWANVRDGNTGDGM